jgi:PAS domain S-box-containing protein
VTPPPSSPLTASWLVGGGEMGARVRALDWSKTPLGPLEAWPQSLRTAVRIALDSRYPMFVWWGEERINLYNDAYIPVLGARHPSALGRPAPVVWPDIWHVVGPQAEIVLREGRATWNESLLLVMERYGYAEETYFTFSYSPVPDDAGRVGGVFCACTEDTARILSERRLRTLRRLGERSLAELESPEGVCRGAAATLAEDPHDLPFALVYLLEPDGAHARLAAAAGLAVGGAASPARLALGGAEDVWELARVVAAREARLVDDLETRFGRLPAGPWPDDVTRRALVLPLDPPGAAAPPFGFLIAGSSPRLAFDAGYRSFLELAAGQLATALADARAYELERRRAESLAELDRAKITFFSNVSHEFRTPLTLLLGPLEEALALGAALPEPARESLALAHRSSLRLLKLVNSLLDFSRIEAGRVHASYQPTDLAALTADLASNFRSACEKAGLALRVDCPPLAEPVYVDGDLWEKVVLNLLSNAFKFTWEGVIEVSLRAEDGHAVLRVRDTGVGIPAAELPHVFERFHRVEGTRGRTFEGTGIGLALVQELVRLHGGEVGVESRPGDTVFRVSLPLGSSHLPSARVGAARAVASTATGAAPYVEEALRSLADEAASEPGPASASAEAAAALGDALVARSAGGRIVLADDNADMRDYVRRLLSARFRVDTAPDGERALALVRRSPPDLVLADVMMPGLDGFGLLRALRADPATRAIPVILLSARAGEEARVEGLDAGADDYLVKPFGARELLARVATHLELAAVRKRSEAAVRESAERLQLALAASRTYAWTLDLGTGAIEWMDPSAPAAQAGDASRIHPDDVAPVRARFAEAIAAYGELSLDHRIVRPDGRLAWLHLRGRVACDDAGRPVRVVGTALDITERKRTEEALRESEERYRSLFESIDEAFIVCELVDDAGGRGPDYRLIEANPAFEAITGFPREKAVGRTVRELMPGLEPVWLEGAARVVETGRPERFENFVGERGRWYEGYSLPRGGRRFATLFSDVTERKRSEAKLVEADRRKDEFLATLAHELRNPLAALRNALALLEVSDDEPETRAYAREMMNRQLGQLVRLIDDLLDVSRISQGKFELRRSVVELGAIVREALDAARPHAAERAVALELPTEAVTVDGDPVRLAQVFGNLLHNAVKFTDPGGRIAVQVERRGADAVVSVVDDGVGIPPERLAGIFELFAQVDTSRERSHGGLGIGLTLVKRLVEMHGGAVDARSEGLGKGSAFQVRLPLAEAPARAAEPSSDAEPAPAAALRILTVDDNRDAADGLVLLLERAGHQVVTAHDGEEAVRAAGELQPDAVVLDIGLPKLDGYEVARRIRAEGWAANVVLVALTGFGQESDRRQARDAGFDCHLVKPVDPRELLRTLATLCAARAS